MECEGRDLLCGKHETVQHASETNGINVCVCGGVCKSVQACECAYERV